MRIQIKVTPRARQKSIQQAADGNFLIKVTEPADEGKANAAVIEALAEHFGVPKRSVTILRGETSRQKLVEIAGR